MPARKAYLKSIRKQELRSSANKKKKKKPTGKTKYRTARNK